MFDNDWEEFRAMAHKFVREKEESVIKEWLDKIGYTEPVGYYRNGFSRTMEIYATRVGELIGKAGVNVEELKKLMTEEFCGEWNVKLVEIRGGFVNVK